MIRQTDKVAHFDNLRFSWFSQRFTDVTGVDTSVLLGKTREETGIPNVDPEAWRDRFPILESSTYLVNHSLGAMPAAVNEKLQAFADQWATRGVRAWAEGWWSMAMEVGDLVGRVIRAPKGSVTMHQNVSLASSLRNSVCHRINCLSGARFIP